jgi:hypothetical protein
VRATSHNSRGACERCGRLSGFVLAAGFNGDGSFRHLCAGCERIERPQLQKRLFAGVRVVVPESETLTERVPEPVIDRRQMALF